MTKRDIVVRVASDLDITQTLAKKVFEGSLDVISEALSKGDKVELRDFGIFKVKSRKNRIGRNPRTGETVPIPSKKVAYFKPGKALKNMIR